MQGDDDVEYDVPEEDIQLGFLEPGNNESLSKSNWKEWDGGKVGGKPIWLDPEHIPSSDTLLCKNCDHPMTFLLQIYCPLDEPDSAFHRALYVFVCNKARCVEDGSYKCLRVQLKKENPYYSTDPIIAVAFPGTLPQLCEVCGCRGQYTCGKCRSAHYCSKSHQKQHWSSHKSSCGTGLPAVSASTTALFPEYTIVIEDEILHDEPVPEANPDDATEEPDANFDSQLTVPTSDPTYVQFLTRIAQGGTDQVLRYVCHRRGCVPLPITAAPPITPSACGHCGAASVLEFQIMPQLLHYLQVDADTKLSATTGENKDTAVTGIFLNDTTKDIDWGTLDVYTCKNSCDAACGNYVEEYIWKQAVPSVDTPSGTVQCSVTCGQDALATDVIES